MIKKEDISYEEMLEDMKNMLGTPEMYEYTLSTMVLNEDEELIFKRAALQLKKTFPDKDIIQRAYEILILKSFHNKDTNKYDTQGIKGNKQSLSNIKEEEKESIFHYIGDNLGKILVFTFILLAISKIV